LVADAPAPAAETPTKPPVIAAAIVPTSAKIVSEELVSTVSAPDEWIEVLLI
jgi:hypothetical protein